MKPLRSFNVPGWISIFPFMAELLCVMVTAFAFLYAAVGLQNSVALNKCRKAAELRGAVIPESEGRQAFTAVPFPSPTPWNSIGGCGAGGSGGGVDDGVRWIGSGVQGGLIDVEIIPRYTIRKNFNQVTIPPRLSFKPSWTTTAAVMLPVMTKNGDVHYLSNQTPEYHTTGGMGDLTIDISKSLGFSGEYDLQLSLTLPTGQYDIKRGSDRSMSFLPVDFQMGSGIYTAALRLIRTFDVEDGFWRIEGSYSHPFNMKPFTGKNEMLDTYYEAYKDRTGGRRFYYRFKPYGENDLGGYTPPSVSLSGYYAYRGIEGYVHSWGIYISAPLGTAWIPSPDIGTYDPRPDPDHMMWNSAFVYELEFSRPKYPLLLAVSLPLHDRRDGRGRIDAPDWDDFLNQWIFAVGIKSTMF
ncbi:MAG: hypothetical protein JW913_10720 [Chitinispirillaceae bacterium]|nr:hypothetical protein [Chitinispirillaceae bacterium]